MGKKLLFVCLFFLSLGMVAQNLQIRDTTGVIITGDTITFTHVIDNDNPVVNFNHKKFMQLYNNVNRDVVIGLTRIEHQTVAGTEEFYCFGQSCLAPRAAGVEPVRTSADTLQARANSIVSNDNNPFTVYVDPNRVGGVSLFEYKFADPENSNVSASIFVRWVINHKVGLNESSIINKFSIGPNPAVNQTTLKFEKALSYNTQSLQVFDILGKIVKEEKLNQGVSTVNLNVEDLNPGIYFVNVFANGSKLNAKKLIVQ